MFKVTNIYIGSCTFSYTSVGANHKSRLRRGSLSRRFDGKLRDGLLLRFAVGEGGLTMHEGKLCHHPHAPFGLNDHIDTKVFGCNDLIK